ncbi:MAG: DUF2190 family protein [Sphingobium sp.]
MQKTSLFTMTAIAAAAVAANRFVGLLTGQHCGAGLKAQGVSHYAAATGEAFAVTVYGTEIVETAGVFAAGAALKSDAAGKAVAQAGDGVIVAYAVTPSTAAGQKVEVLLCF